jgi:hypothetical protein
MSVEILLPPCALPRENLAVGPLQLIFALIAGSRGGSSNSPRLRCLAEHGTVPSRHWLLAPSPSRSKVAPSSST